MPARPARKRIHYLRAVYAEGAHPDQSFQQILIGALGTLPEMQDTQVAVPHLGVVAIPHRDVEGEYVSLAVGAGAPDEAMSTLGINVADADDDDTAQPPPRNRAYKTADAFCYVEEDEFLVCVDGGMRVPAVENYLHSLLAKANIPPESQAFELRPVSDIDKEDVLDREGVKELKLCGTMSEAGVELHEAHHEPQPTLAGAWRQFKGQMAAVFAREGANEDELNALAAHFAELQVTTTLYAKGGSRAEPIVLESMESIGRELLDDAPDDVEIILVTSRGSMIKTSELVLGKYVNLNRQENKNDLHYLDVWAALRDYRVQLVTKRRPYVQVMKIVLVLLTIQIHILAHHKFRSLDHAAPTRH